jgi:hypothetical protein
MGRAATFTAATCGDGGSVVDAVVAATAHKVSATAVLTSDPADLTTLLADTQTRVVAV